MIFIFIDVTDIFCQAKAEEITCLISNLLSEDAAKAFEAYESLWKIGIPAIPLLLDHCNDLSISSLQVPIHPYSSYIPKEFLSGKYCQTKGTVCLYMIEAIRLRSILHCQIPAIRYSTQKIDSYSINQKENQKLATEAYKIWWEQKGKNGDMDSKIILVPWEKALWVFPEKPELNEEWSKYFKDKAVSIQGCVQEPTKAKKTESKKGNI